MTDAKGAAEATVESLVTIVIAGHGCGLHPDGLRHSVQLLAYHAAVIMGTDVDQPRNLAKSVTVE
jgi:glucosamine--fructose-6-phosphate aminotransferase (isomerizing)